MLKKEIKFKVKTYETQQTGELHVHSLMQYLQELASSHAETLGWGYKHLKKKNCFWVLVNLKIIINRLPAWKDEVLIQTWPSGHDRLKAYREFQGFDNGNNELFRAGSEWMILDHKNGRPLNLKDVDFGVTGKSERIIDNLKRLKPSENYSKAGSIIVPYSSIDVNGHVNNTEFIKWGNDLLRKEKLLSNEIDSIQITFLSEIFENEELELFVNKKDSLILLLGRRRSDQKNIFLMEIGY